MGHKQNLNSVSMTTQGIIDSRSTSPQGGQKRNEKLKGRKQNIDFVFSIELFETNKNKVCS